MPSRPPSIRDIARVCGYGKSTVAAALSNNPEIPATTSSLIRDAAQRLGYRRDALVSSLAARRWRTRPNAVAPLLAYVYDFGDETVHGGPPMDAVRAAADDYGYRVEAVDLRGFASDERASRALYTRGYRGLVIGRILRRERPLELDWPRFTAVAFDLGFVRPPLHVVMLDRFAATRQAVLRALSRGYRRPGFVHLVHSAAEEVDPSRLGGYLAGCANLPAADRLPVHVGQFHDNQGLGFTEWLADTRPDVVIGLNSLVLWWLRRAQIHVPGDVGFITLEHNGGKEVSTTGCLKLDATASRGAVELLVGQIHINARGIPNPLQTVLVEPVWHEGTTLVPRPMATPPVRPG